MFEVVYQTKGMMVHIRIDATMLWAVIQMLVLVERYLANILT